MGYLPYQLVQDFVHQQYHYNKISTKMQLATRCFSRCESIYAAALPSARNSLRLRLCIKCVGMEDEGWGMEGHKEVPYEPNKKVTFQVGTPWKMNMEPENHLFEKENHLPTIHFQGRTVKLRGCTFSNVLSLDVQLFDAWNMFQKRYSPKWIQMVGTVPSTHTEKKSKKNWRLPPVLKAPKNQVGSRESLKRITVRCKLAVGSSRPIIIVSRFGSKKSSRSTAERWDVHHHFTSRDHEIPFGITWHGSWETNLESLTPSPKKSHGTRPITA